MIHQIDLEGGLIVRGLSQTQAESAREHDIADSRQAYAAQAASAKSLPNELMYAFRLSTR